MIRDSAPACVQQRGLASLGGEGMSKGGIQCSPDTLRVVRGSRENPWTVSGLATQQRSAAMTARPLAEQLHKHHGLRATSSISEHHTKATNVRDLKHHRRNRRALKASLLHPHAREHRRNRQHHNNTPALHKHLHTKITNSGDSSPSPSHEGLQH